MLRPFFSLTLLVLSFIPTDAAELYRNNRAPLAPQKYIALPLGAIKPEGWLKEQLLAMRNGSTGKLDEYYSKIKDDNGWLGGKGDGWEETPYWLDGALPLAYLLDDKELKAKVQKYVDWSIENQRPNGYFGARSKAEFEKGKMESAADGEDWWPRMVMLKVLQQYYSATGDERVIKMMTNYFHYQLANLEKYPLSKWTFWAPVRGGDNLMVVYWLYNITGDESLLKLGELLYKQTDNWTEMLGGREWAINASVNQTGDGWIQRHAVNVAMGLKTPVIYYQAHPEPRYADALKTGFKDLMNLHGLPHGMFSGDEDIHGNEPTQGVELCAIVETMFSLELAIGITGDQHYMDALERMTYNVLPAQTTDDYMSRQYFGMANQVEVKKGPYDFSLPLEGTCNLYGHYAGYTCCTANMHQGWTKFVSHLWFATPEKGLMAAAYGPSNVKAKVGDGTEVSIQEKTGYPFEDTIHFTVTTPKTVSFPLELRIPGWCKEATVSINGQKLRSDKGGQIIKIEREWKSGDTLDLQLPMEVTTSSWARNSRTVERGPLVYALKIKEDFKEQTHEKEGRYFDITAGSAWNYGLPQSVLKEPAKQFNVTTKAVPEKGVPWNQINAPVEISATGKKIPQWKIVDGVARQPVTSRDGFYQGEVAPDAEPITLIPFGCTKLRIVAFPIVK